MSFWDWLRGREDPSPTEVAEAAFDEAYVAVCVGIDMINENMPLLAGQRLSLYVDREYKPARIVLTDWSQTQPMVVHGHE